MFRYITALLSLLNLASSLVVSRNSPEGPALESTEDGDQSTTGLCDAAAFYDANARFAADDWEALKTSPCVGDQLYNEVISGERDKVDSSEFLGKNTIQRELVTEQSYMEKTMLPQILFLGLPHSGSTSLAEEMNTHPELSYGLMKEHNMLYELGKTDKNDFKRAYQSTFLVEDDLVNYTFDASPATLFIANVNDVDMLKHHAIATEVGTGIPGVKAVKHLLGPHVKFIVMLRDPLDWQMSMSPDAPDTSIARYLTEKQLLGDRACYADSVEIWMQVFGRDSILFLESSEYFANQQSTLDEVFKFLNVSQRQYEPAELSAEGRRRISRRALTQEREVFWKNERMRECKERLEKLTGRTWPWGPP